MILIQEPVATVRSKYVQLSTKIRDACVDPVQFDDVVLNYSDAEVSGSESEENLEEVWN